MRDIAARVESTRDALTTPVLDSLETCGSLAVQDAGAIAFNLLAEALTAARRQIEHLVRSLEGAVRDFEEAEEHAQLTALGLRRRMRS